MLAILAGCYTDYPASPSPDNLPISLLQKGVDITLGFGSNPSQDHSTKWLLLQTWINSFWPYASGANEVAGEKLNLQEALEFAKPRHCLMGRHFGRLKTSRFFQNSSSTTPLGRRPLTIFGLPGMEISPNR